MFLPTQLHEEIIDANKNRYTLRLGNCVPDNAVNLAYYYNKKILPDSSLLISEAPKNIIDHKIVGQWVSKRGLTSISDAYFTSSIPYHDEDGYSGQLQRKFIDWTTNIHIEKELATSVGNYSALVSNFALPIDRTNVTDGLYSGKEYLMDIGWTVAGTVNMLQPNTIEKECVGEVTVEGLSSPSYGSFPLNLQFIKSGYSGLLNKNGSPTFDLEFTTGGGGTVEKTNLEQITVAGQKPSMDSFTDTDGTYYVLKSYTEAKQEGTVVTEDVSYGNTAPPAGTTKLAADGKTTLTYVPGSYKLTTSKPITTWYHTYGLSNYNGGAGNNDAYGFAAPSLENGHWEDKWPALMQDVYGRTEGNVVYTAAFGRDPSTGLAHNPKSYFDTNGNTITSSSDFFYDLDTAGHYCGNGCPGMAWLDTLLENYSLPLNYTGTARADMDPGTDADSKSYSDSWNTPTKYLNSGNGRPVTKGNDHIRYTIAFYKWSKTVTVTGHMATFSGSTPTEYGLLETYEGTSSGTVSTTYKGTQRYNNKLIKDASFLSPVANSWNAQINYRGVLQYSWTDYDAAGFYEGSVVKHSAIGNGNPEGSNQQLMYPDDYGVLFDLNNKKEIESEEFVVTNMFKDGVPLFYKCKLQYKIFDSNGPDALGMYIGNSIKLLTPSMKPLNPRKYKYSVQIKPVPPDGTNTDLYEVYIYTSFLTSSSLSILCSYSAYDDTPGLDTIDRLMPSTVEAIEVQPFYELGKDYKITNTDAIARINYITVLNNNIISDTRKVIPFHYVVRTSDGVYTSSTIPAEAINIDYAFDTELGNYNERNLTVSPLQDGIPMTGYEIIKRDCAASLQDIHGEYDATKLATLSTKTFIAEFKDVFDGLVVNEGLVNLFTEQDGSSVVSVETTADTGFLDSNGGYTDMVSLPSKYEVINKKIYSAYQVMCKDARLIKVLPPRESDALENWYPRIQFSHFTQVYSNHGMDVKNVYSMPEFDNQSYSPVHGKPYIDIVDEKAIILNEHMVKVKNCPMYVHVDSEFLPTNLNLRKLDINGNYKTLVISNWNYTEGIIELRDIISENDNILISYTFEEQSYVYRGYYDDLENYIDIDMNPSQYHDFLDLRYEPYQRRPVYDLFNAVIYFFMRPSEIVQTKTYGDSLTSSNNVFPLTLESTQSGYSGELVQDGPSTVESGSLDIYRIDTINNLYGSIYPTASQVTSTLPYSQNGFIGTLKIVNTLKDLVGYAQIIVNGLVVDDLNSPIYNNFQGVYSGDVVRAANDSRIWIQYYTGGVSSSTINTKTLYHKFDDSIPTDKYDIMLGSVHVRQNASLKSTTVIDTRTRGGGILEEMYDAMRKELEPESDYYWDIGYWDGKPYTENAVAIIRLDRRILVDYGGRFTTEEVEGIAHKWITAGVFPLIEYVTTYTKEELPQATLSVDSTYNNKIEYTPYAFATVIQE